ncbi:hypothetical protein B0H13DRAFT_1865062 [Mycena leptocephala]|nr:hypothetical protein B0H13DRAFT_1865062 [Mycena leptocephala]
MDTINFEPRASAWWTFRCLGGAVTVFCGGAIVTALSGPWAPVGTPALFSASDVPVRRDLEDEWYTVDPRARWSLLAPISISTPPSVLCLPAPGAFTRKADLNTLNHFIRPDAPGLPRLHNPREPIDEFSDTLPELATLHSVLLPPASELPQGDVQFAAKPRMTQYAKIVPSWPSSERTQIAGMYATTLPGHCMLHCGGGDGRAQREVGTPAFIDDWNMDEEVNSTPFLTRILETAAQTENAKQHNKLKTPEKLCPP